MESAPPLVLPSTPPPACVAPYLCYILKSADGRKTYVGITNNMTRRLRQHNGEISGGAKYTSRQGARPWRIMVLVRGFQDKIQALQFEWALHHMRGGGGPTGRLAKLVVLLHKPRWTRPSPLASSVPLRIHVAVDDVPPSALHTMHMPAHCSLVMTIDNLSDEQ